MSNTNIRNNESFIFSIRLNDKEDDNEYLINISKNATNNIELYDFNNDIIYEKILNNFFHSLSVRFMRVSVIKISNSENNCIIGIIVSKYDKEGKGTPHFF